MKWKIDHESDLLIRDENDQTVLIVNTNRGGNVDEVKAIARLAVSAPDMLKWLQQIARTNCTCDFWTNAADPAEHDLYCMFRVMTGYQETAEKETNEQ